MRVVSNSKFGKMLSLLKESRDINNVIYASEESKTSNSKNSFEMKKLK